MKAAVLRGIDDLRLEEVDDPSPGRDEVLIRIKACGVCGTDIHMWEGKNNEGTFPFIPGHEWSGEVMEVGRDIKALSAGDLVVGEPFIGCGVCSNCRDGIGANMCEDWEYYGFSWDHPGGMAEYVVTKQPRLYKVPEGLSHEEAALVEPVSVCHFAIWGLAGGVAPHDRVVIFGAGPIGMLGLLTCNASGAPAVVVEPGTYRRKMAEDLGAASVIDPTQGDVVQQILDHTGGRGATLILECSGTDQALAATMDVIAKHGRICLIGHSIGRKVPIEIGRLIWQGATVVGSPGAPFYFEKTLAFMALHLVDLTEVITQRFSLNDVQEAFSLGKRTTDSVKILLEP